MQKRMSLRTVVVWIAVIAVAMVVCGVGLLYLGAVAKVLPKGLGLFANLPDLLQAVIWIVVLAVIAIGAWVLLPKGRAGAGAVQEGEQTPPR